jgi:hypothetical protein
MRIHPIATLALALAGVSVSFGAAPAWADICIASDTSSGNTACGTDADNNDSGFYNTAVGDDALESNTGSDNTALGYLSLQSNTNGDYNTGIGTLALYRNQAGEKLTAVGFQALYSNGSGGDNTATGSTALYSNETGADNTATGSGALYANTASDNTADGSGALAANTGGANNTAVGYSALFYNTTGANNTASGAQALYSNFSGSYNVASGYEALYSNTIGYHNVALGYNAGGNNTVGGGNTFIGFDANAGHDNLINATALGNGAVVSASNSIVFGNTNITKISAKVGITVTSDRRLKKDIAALDPSLGLAFIEKLQPVSYRFKNGDETQRYGFIAQDLEQALPAALHDTVETSEPEHGLALVERQNDADRTYRVSYGELTAPMVKAIQEQQQEIADLRQIVKDQAAAMEALRAQVGARLARD